MPSADIPGDRHYKSFSLFHRHGPRDLWRRISMWLIMLSRLASLILMFAIFLSGVYLDTGGILVMVVLMLVGVIIFMINAWCVALIGDVTGTRRVVGITVVSRVVVKSCGCEEGFADGV